MDDDKAEAQPVPDECVLHVCSMCGEYAKWPANFCSPKCQAEFLAWFDANHGEKP